MKNKFRTTEISDPRFESEQLRFITVKSKHLSGRGDICVFVPRIKKGKPLPLVILLHGVYGSSWSWSQQGGVHMTARQLISAGTICPMVIAMPSDGLWGDGSGYVPHGTSNFEKWIVDDVPSAVMEHVECVRPTSKIFIGGLSMGGFGALQLGLKYASKFTAISAHSAITDSAQMAQFVEESLTNYRQQDNLENSIIGIVKKYASISLPKIRFDCGANDTLLEPNRKLHKSLDQMGVPHSYEEFEGGHEWTYWQEHIKDSLKFFSTEAIS